MSKSRKTRQSPHAGATPQAADEANEPDGGASESASADGGGSQDAKPSNSGDRFHFVLVARRLLDMLPPSAAVQRIEVEDVVSEDLPSATSDERFVGVDVTEYEGGPDGLTARRVVLKQAKYSATHPDRVWNLTRLVASTKPCRQPRGPLLPRSVFGKPATAHVSLRDEIAAVREGPGTEIVVRLQTNQLLDPVLRGQVEAIRRAGADQPPLTAGADLDSTSAPLPPEVLATWDACARRPYSRTPTSMRSAARGISTRSAAACSPPKKPRSSAR